MIENDEREDRAVLEALALLEAEAPDEALRAPADPGAPADEADARETLRRLYAETLGLLAYAPEPVAPEAGARERLLAALGGSPADTPAPEPEPAPTRESSAEPAPIAEWAAAGPPPRRGGRVAPWLAALAAVLLVAVAGLAGWLWLELAAARSSLARLETDRTRLAERLDDQEDLIRRAGGSGEFLAAVATPGVEVCPLRPVGDPPMMPRAYAVLYMPPGSGEWYLLASNLEPDRGVYKVWIHTPDGAVPMGLLPAGKAATLELDLPPALDERHELML
ncbi:MAG TPA: anti-sigma factor, partial [Thermoanaerobaculia bacterium]